MQEKAVETKYAIEAPTYRCAACAGEIAHGSTYLSAIVFEGEIFLRREFCGPCWDRDRSGAEAAFAFWKARRPEPPAPPPRRRRFDVDLVWTFFERLRRDLDAAPSPPAPPPAPSPSPAPEPEIAAEPASDSTLEAAAAPPAAEKIRLCFLLALLLVRSKRLVLEGTAVRGGREWLRLSRKGEPGTAYLVENPDLDASDLEQVKDALGRLLEMEL